MANTRPMGQAVAVPRPWWKYCPSCLVLAQSALALTALVLLLRGNGHQTNWLALALVLPVLRFACQAEFRRRILEWLQSTWKALANYPSVSQRTPWLAAFIFAVAPVWVLLMINDRVMGTGDTWPVMPTAWSLVNRGTWDIGEMVPSAPATYMANPADDLPYCVQRRGDGIYSSYPAGMVVFALPVAVLCRTAGADLGNVHYRGRIEKLTAALVTALSLGLFFLAALHLAPPWPAWLATLMLGTGSALFSTCGQALWQHAGLIFWSLLILWLEFRQHACPETRISVLQGLAAGMMLACRLSAVVFLAPFVLWVFCRAPRRALAFTGLAALAYAPWAWMYCAIYGNPFGPSTGQLAAVNWSANFAESLAGVLISPARGWLVYQPWTLLVALAGLLWWRRNGPKTGLPPGWPLFCLGAIFLQLAMVACWRCWWGGHCWGSRLLAEAMPLMALFCLPAITWMSQHRIRQGFLLGLVLVSFLLHAAAVYAHADHWNNIALPSQNAAVLWSWSRPPFLYLFHEVKRAAK